MHIRMTRFVPINSALRLVDTFPSINEHLDRALFALEANHRSVLTHIHQHGPSTFRSIRRATNLSRLQLHLALDRSILYGHVAREWQAIMSDIVDGACVYTLTSVGHTHTLALQLIPDTSVAS